MVFLSAYGLSLSLFAAAACISHLVYLMRSTNTLCSTRREGGGSNRYSLGIGGGFFAGLPLKILPSSFIPQMDRLVVVFATEKYSYSVEPPMVL